MQIDTLLSGNIQIAFKIEELKREDQLQILRGLLIRTGILDIIYKEPDQNPQTEAIDAAWEAFRKG